MGIHYASGAYNRAEGTRSAFDRWADALVAEGYPRPTVLSGDREPDVQLAIWYQRMVTADRVNGRKVYGTKKWNGILWYQIHPNAVATPNSSNHEKRRANDLAYPYNTRTAAHARGKQLAPKFNITCEGEGFSELWHWTYWGALGAISTASGAGSDAKPFEPETNEDQEDTMRFIDGANIIVWPNGILSSYELNRYTLIKQFVLYPTHPEWSKGRDVFEAAAWEAFNLGVSVIAAATAKSLPALDADENVDLDALAGKIASLLPKSFTVTPTSG